jgi:hypothetical protein
MEEKTVMVEVSFTDEESSEVISLLEEVGAKDIQEGEERGFAGVALVVVGILVVNALVNLVMKLLRLWQCGVIVDASGSTISTQKNCDLPRGTVLVLNPDGTQSKLHEPSELEIGPLIKALILGNS